jgi:hypothetical protein
LRTIRGAFEILPDVCELPAGRTTRYQEPNPLIGFTYGMATPLLWEILWFYALLFGQFHGYTHQLNGQFHGICLKESQPPEQTSAGRAAPLERTFRGVNAPEKRTSRQIPQDLTKLPTRTAKNATCHPTPIVRRGVRSRRHILSLARHRFILEYQRYT